MKEELQVGDLVRFDNTFRSTTWALAMATAVTKMATVICVENYTKFNNGIALIIDIISNREYYEHDGHDIFKIILNNEVRYLYRDEVQYAKKVS